MLISGLKRNGISVRVETWECRKLPVLAVYVEKDNCAYKVASFNSEETARWFCEVMEEFFDGMTEKKKAE